MDDVEQAPCCDRCGAPDAAALGDMNLCPDCFQLAGSSCGGGGVRRDAGGGVGEAGGSGEGC